MRKIKKITYIGLAIAVASLLLVNAGATNIPTETDDVNNMMVQVPFTIKHQEQTMCTENLGGIALVSVGSEEDNYCPAITKDQQGNIVVTWTSDISILETNIGLGYSDDGNTWNANYVALEDAMPKFSDIAYVHGADFEGGGDFTGLWGVFGDVLGNFEGFYRMTDITDDTTYEVYTWSSESPDITYCAISDNTWYKDMYYDITGPTNMYIEYSSLCGLDACPLHMFADGALEGGAVMFHDCQQGLATAPAYDPDLVCIHDSTPAQTVNDYLLLTWQYDDPEEGNKIVFKKIIPDEESDIEYTPYEFYIGPGTNPNIGASGDKSVVTYMNNGNVVSAYSSDRGTTFDTTTIGPGNYPAVYMSGSNAYCVYINNGNLYLVGSSDAGATWGEPERINDVDGTVVEEENAIDIHPAGIVWTDNRDGNKNIYYGSGVAAPEINIATISGGFGVSAEIENVGSADATNVQWSIDLEGGLVIVGSHADGTIPTLAAGTSQTVKIGFVLGIGGVTITVAADGATKTASGTVLGPFVIGVA